MNNYVYWTKYFYAIDFAYLCVTSFKKEDVVKHFQLAP